ncbi:MAG: tail fiber domain-containing protein [Tahibacter sp.]
MQNRIVTALVAAVLLSMGMARAFGEGVVDAADGRPYGSTPMPASPPTTPQAAEASGRTDTGGTPLPNDQVIPDDLIVQGSACVGLDCVNNESFGFDTLRLKENNTRIKFEDTSASAGFASDDWQLTANDSESGGTNKFSIENITGATVPFTVSGPAPTNSLFIGTTGRIGLRTASPALDLHIQTTDTPAIRLDQTNAGGFTAQTWDVAGNEANFFVRDVTGGSRLPLRIRPGAPTSSVDVAASGNVGMGTASPGSWLEISHSAPASARSTYALRVINTSPDFPAGQSDRFVVDSSGNVTARGNIYQLSSRTSKENFSRNNHKMILAKLEKLEIPSWNYRGSPTDDRHLGPVAEDFHDSFGLGKDGRFVATGDVAGIALLSAQALQAELRERDTRIADLEARLAALESRLTHAAQ